MTLNSSNQLKLFSHQAIFDTLTKLFKEKKLPNKILFSGERGLGKSTISYHLINYILSNDEEFSYNINNYEINPENKSFKLIQNGSNPNFNLIDINNDKKIIEINQIRELINSLNKSSFNQKSRFVLINNLNYLNKSSVNALLKVLEEPNDGIIFILINHNKFILPTIKSRCLTFKVFLSNNESIQVINKILDEDIYSLMNKELINYYSTPGKMLEIINFSKEYDIDIKSINLKKFLSIIINDKMYKVNKSVKDLIHQYIELYFRRNISSKNIRLLDLYGYFLKRIDDTKTYNLDDEVLFMEFEEMVLND